MDRNIKPGGITFDEGVTTSLEAHSRRITRNIKPGVEVVLMWLAQGLWTSLA